MHYLLQPGPALPDRFAYLIGGLCHCLGAIFTRDRSTGPFTLLIHARLRKLQARFAAIVAGVEAGTVRTGRARGASRAARVASPRLMPSDFGWLCRLMPEGNVYATYLEDQMRTDAALAAVLAKAPEAGRVLRSVLWMMGRPVPEMLRPPKAPPRPSRAKAKPPEKLGTPYRAQPPKSHYPASVWPTEAQMIRAGRRLARAASRRILPN